MSNSLDLSLKLDEFIDAARALATKAPKALRPAFEEIGIEQVQYIHRRIEGYSQPLAKSVQIARADLSSNPPVLRIGSALAYAAITQFGGTVQTFEARGLSPTAYALSHRADPTKPIKYLTVPLTRLGNVRKTDRARDYQNLFVMKGEWFKNPRPGKLYLAQRTVEVIDVVSKKTKTRFVQRHGQKLTTKGAKRGFRLMFALIDKCVIQPHPYLYWSPADQDLALLVMMRHLRDARGMWPQRNST